MLTKSPSMPPIAARQQALEATFAPWRPRTLDQLLDDMAARYPDRDFVVTDERTWTYSEMAEWVQRLSTGLVEAGVKPGEHVAVVLANYPEFVAVKFAIARAGAVMVPVNYLNRRDELGFVLRQSDSVMLITMDRFRDLDYLAALDELAPGWQRAGGGSALPRLRRVIVFPTGAAPSRPDLTLLGSLERVPAEEPQSERAATPDPASVSDIIFTSGTTGSPKGVMLTHDQFLRSGYGSAFARAFEDGRRILFSLPMYHVYGYVEGMLSAMFAGGAIIPQLKFDAAMTLDGIERHGATDVLLIPTMTLALIDEQKRRRRALLTLRSVLSSGGRAPSTIWSSIREWLGPEEITTGYGMTECTASTTVTRPDDPPAWLLQTNGRLRDVGAAGAGPHRRLVEYRIVDQLTGRDVGAGEVGELIAQGPGVTRGYYNNPDATQAAFTADGWLHTGDLGRIDGDGYLTLEGRLKESYRCGGETVLPGETENQLMLHPSVQQAHVVPVPDARMGEVGAAFIVLRPEAAFDEQALIEHCRSHLARFKVPKYVLPIAAEAIPVTPSGRPRKFLLTRIAVEKLGLPR